MRMRPVSVFGLMVLAAASVGFGGQARYWTHQAEEDFRGGRFENVVVDSYGQLTLGRAVQAVKVPRDVDLVNGFAQGKDGAVYFVTSPEGKVYRMTEKGEAEEYWTAPESHDALQAVIADGEGNLLVAACGGDGCRLVRLSGPAGNVASKIAWEGEDVTAIWAMARGPDGGLYLATGPEGKVLRVDTDSGKSQTILETGGKNVLSLAFDSNGRLVAGTDGGLVLRQEKGGKAFVLLDAGKVDVTAIVPGENGAVYVATATPEGGMMGGFDDEGGLRSRPGDVDPDMPDADLGDEPPGTMPRPEPLPKKSGGKGKAGALLAPLPAGVLGQRIPGEMAEMPAELKAFLKKAAGPLEGDEGPATRKKPATKKRPGGMPLIRGGAGEDEGSAVRRIGPDGTVKVLMRSEGMVLSLARSGDELLVGTGGEGKLYRYDLKDASEALLARLNNENIMALFRANDGTVWAGASNDGGVYKVSADVAAQGTYVSDELDAGHGATWGRARLMAEGVADGAGATIAVRTGNVRDVKKQERFWSDWSEEIPAGDVASGKTPNVPGARYLQYRITLQGKNGGTPAVQQVRVAYQVENLPPKLGNVRVENVAAVVAEAEHRGRAAEEGPPREVFISWDGRDPNGDALTYRVLYRDLSQKDAPWVQIARDLTDTSFSWNTRSVPDGRYQVKVIASDAADNLVEEAQAVAQVAAPVAVDNTPPAVEGLQGQAEGGRVKVTGAVKDASSAVVEVRYQINGGEDWHPAASSDKIFDSPSESFTLVTKPLSAGSHRITVRATDALGNSAYDALTVKVDK